MAPLKEKEAIAAITQAQRLIIYSPDIARHIDVHTQPGSLRFSGDVRIAALTLSDIPR
jgi:hypothetical protein